MRTVTLNNGVEMPILGFGVFQISDEKECERAVLDAITTGYRLIDTAESYMNEEAVGRAIKRSGIPRKELFITTKIWIQNYGYDSTLKAFDNALKRLQLDYLDLYLMHSQFGDVHGTWRAMEELYKAGKIRAIGVSNFYNDRLMDVIVHNEIVPAINQVETHPFYQQEEAQEFMTKNKVQIQSWGPLAEGRNNIFNNELLASIAKKYNKSIAQVILRWLTQRGVIVIPKTVSKERMEENFNVFDFSLSNDDMETIKTLDDAKGCMFDFRDPATVKWFGEYRIGDPV